MKYLKRYGIALFAATAMFSCEKSLDVKPTDVIIEEFAFPDIPNLERGLLGVYSNFNGNGAYDNDIYATALYSDEAMLPIENNTGRGVIAYRWQTDPGIGEVTDAWAAYYFGIDRANRIIAAADKLTGLSVTDEAIKTRIKGEAIALRAFAHLQLLINFSEKYDADALSVPFVEKSGIQKPGRLKFSAVVAKINADLQTAQTSIPSSFNNKTRMTLAAVHAIRARTALYAKDWDGAISASTAAIAAVPLDSRAEHPAIWTDASTSGVIWKIRRDAGQARLGDAFYDRTQQKIMYAPSQELISTFATGDIRIQTTILSRGAGRPSLAKYVGGDAAEPGRADVKVFRTAEMYLIRAEAYAEKNQITQASMDLNTLRAARISGYTPQVLASKDAAITEIYLERFKELAFEGHRMSDLRRRLLPVTRIPADAVNALGAVTLNPNDKQYWYPIPGEEILANENVLQNPTYR